MPILSKPPRSVIRTSRSSWKKSSEKKFVIASGSKRKQSKCARTAGRSERKRLIDVLDTLWRRAVKTRDQGLCRKCGKLGLEAHHVFSRRHSAIRFMLDNGLSLCPTCHRFAHDNPDSFHSWASLEVGEERFELLERARYWPELTLGELDSLVMIYKNRLKGDI